MKKSFKALLGVVLSIAMIVGMTACGGGSSDESTAESTEQGKVLNIWCWNDEFQSRFNY